MITHLIGDCRAILPTLPDASVQCCVTSPPYWGLRDYGVGGQIGLERTPDEYVAQMVAVFREVRRVLRDDGTLWLNLGDSYAANGERTNNNGQGATGLKNDGSDELSRQHSNSRIKTARMELPRVLHGLKPKDLVGIPWRVAFALQSDGWYLRSDIIWCLSGGTWLYARTQKGVGVAMVRDLARLDPTTVELWNGERWTQLLGMSRSARKGDELEIVLRSGERIACTPTHRFPTGRGVIAAGCLHVGDVLDRCELPEPDSPRVDVLDDDAAWFAGLYVAEGSRSGNAIQIAGHTKEDARWERVQRVAQKFGGSATRTVDGNNMDIRVYGRFLHAVVDEFVSGRTAKDKGFAPPVWHRSNRFVAAMIDGYLSGDGHWDEPNNRWRLGFTRNYNLERDLRTACARLGYTLTLKPSRVSYDGRYVPTFRGELRKERSGHHNERDAAEVVEIRRARCREVYDLGVEDDPHLFALASGVLTHNSKPNPMPESVTDRPTKAHEYLFLLAKSPSYYYDADAIAEPAEYAGTLQSFATTAKLARLVDGPRARNGNESPNAPPVLMGATRNRRSVWTVATQPYSGAHFATFPPKLIEPCILAGSRKGDTVLDPFGGAGTTGLVADRLGRDAVLIELNPAYAGLSRDRIIDDAPLFNTGGVA